MSPISPQGRVGRATSRLLAVSPFAPSTGLYPAPFPLALPTNPPGPRENSTGRVICRGFAAGRRSAAQTRALRRHPGGRPACRADAILGLLWRDGDFLRCVPFLATAPAPRRPRFFPARRRAALAVQHKFPLARRPAVPRASQNFTCEPLALTTRSSSSCGRVTGASRTAQPT
jgi:hypothetical protein